MTVPSNMNNRQLLQGSNRSNQLQCLFRSGNSSQSLNHALVRGFLGGGIGGGMSDPNGGGDGAGFDNGGFGDMGNIGGFEDGGSMGPDFDL